MGLLKEQCAEWKKGTSAVLLQSGPDNEWWADSHGMLLQSAKHSRSLVRWEDTTWKAVRNAIEWTSYPVWSNGRISPYFCQRPVATASVRSKSLARWIPWICVVRGRIWKGDVMVADIEELEQMNVSELHARRLSAKEVLTPTKGEKFIFPVADRTVKVSGGDQRLRAPTLIRDRPDRGEEQGILHAEPDGFSSNPHQQSSFCDVKDQDDSTLDDGEARNDFWSISGDFIYRHHVGPRSNFSCREKNRFLFHWNISTLPELPNTSLDVMLEKYWRLLECWWRLWIVRYVDWLHKIHHIEWKATGWTFPVRRGDWRENKRPQDDKLWPEMRKHMSDASKRKDKQKWAIEKPELDNARSFYVVFTSLILKKRNSSLPWKMIVES